MKRKKPLYYGYRFPQEIISHAVWLCHRFGLSLRDIEEILATRGIIVTYESIRRDCLDHVIVLNQRHLRRILQAYVDYYHGSRTHLSLNKDPPDPRPVEPLRDGSNIATVPQVGGLHHRYVRLAA